MHGHLAASPLRPTAQRWAPPMVSKLTLAVVLGIVAFALGFLNRKRAGAVAGVLQDADEDDEFREANGEPKPKRTRHAYERPNYGECAWAVMLRHVYLPIQPPGKLSAFGGGFVSHIPFFSSSSVAVRVHGI